MDQFIDNNNYFNAENGLLFLHALTCSSIQCFSSNNPVGLLNSLNTVKGNLEEHKQTDPKVGLHFLSRRPFSSMWADLREKGIVNSTFKDLYDIKILQGNPLFTENIAPNFKYVNYAEEYYYGINHERKDLSTLKEKFRELADLSEKQSDDPHLFLLKKGILSTGMTRYLAPNMFDNYLMECIETVDKPSHTYKFNLQTNVYDREISKVDSLSPPWLLEQPNSMGYYRFTDDFNTGGDIFDDNYGEAILEFRSIKDISKDAITASGRSASEYIRGSFLTNMENKSLLEDANALLCILNKTFILDRAKVIIRNNLSSY